MSELSDLTAAVSDLVGRRDLTQVEYANWMGGPIDGGPNGDGIYPLTDGSGFTRLVPGLQRALSNLEAAGGGLNLEGFNALPVATQTQVKAAPPEVVGKTADGELRRFPTDMFGARKTEALDELHSEDWAEWLVCLSNGSQAERRIALSQIQQSVGNVIDPTHAPYNVVYDAQKAKPVAMTAGSNLITITENAFSAARDIGKLLVVGNATSVGPLEGYIGQVIDARNVRIFTDRTFSTPANAQNTRSSEEALWGTDNTAGMQAAFDAAEPTTLYGRGKVVVLGGLALVRRLQFGSISVVGLSSTGTGFWALPLLNSNPFFADKTTGKYATLRPDSYTLRNFQLHGQRFCQFYSSFRNNLEIRGGGFNNFIRGAPYATIDTIESHEAQVNGFSLYGAYAGIVNNLLALQCTQVGIRAALWDLNGQNWHSEGNGGCGLYDLLAGGNVNLVRCSYNGANAGILNIGGQFYPHEMGSNMTIAGYGSNYTNVRLQESQTHAACFSGTDPYNQVTGRGNKNTISLSAWDDTGNMPASKGTTLTRLPGVRAMVYMKGNTVTNNIVRITNGSGQVNPTNYATNAYGDIGDPSGNRVEIETPGISNDPSDWYSGAGALAAIARGPWMHQSSSSIGARGNRVTVNDQLAP